MFGMKSWPFGTFLILTSGSPTSVFRLSHLISQWFVLYAVRSPSRELGAPRTIYTHVNGAPGAIYLLSGATGRYNFRGTKKKTRITEGEQRRDAHMDG